MFNLKNSRKCITQNTLREHWKSRFIKSTWEYSFKNTQGQRQSHRRLSYGGKLSATFDDKTNTHKWQKLDRLQFWVPVASGLLLRYFKLLSVISVKLRLIKPFVNVVGKRCRVEYTPTKPPVTYRSERYDKPNELKLL